MQLPITIGLHRSFFGLAGFTLVHGISVAAILLTPWLPAFKGLAIVGLGFSAVFSWRHWLPKADALRLLGDGRVECRLAGKAEFLGAKLLPGATVHPWLTVVRLEFSEETVTVVVLPDSVTPEDFRRLRVWLRWRADFGVRKDAA